MQPARDLIVACLRAHGATRVFGDPLGGLTHHPVREPELAHALAAADGRLHRVGVAWSEPHRVLYLSSRPGSAPAAEVCDDVAHVTRVVEPAARAVARSHTARAVTLAVDLDTPVPSAARPRGNADYQPFIGRAVADDARVAVLAGPHLVRRDGLEALHRFAAAANVGVANTWGIKGVFRWDSPHHMGTVGLQARDFELVFAGIDVVLAVGVDPDEARPTMPTGVEVVVVDPRQLGDLTGLTARRATIAANPLYERLAAVAQPGYVDERVPHHPARLVALLREQVPPGGLLTADPGGVGWWVARTFSTTELGSVVVPAAGASGVAAAIGAVAALDGRTATVVTEERSELHRAAQDWAEAALGPSAASHVVWGEGDWSVDRSLDAALVDAAGPLVAF